MEIRYLLQMSKVTLNQLPTVHSSTDCLVSLHKQKKQLSHDVLLYLSLYYFTWNLFILYVLALEFIK